MAKFFSALICALLITSCNSTSTVDDKNSNNEDLKQYIIVRYAGLKINYNDGTSRDEVALKDNSGKPLEFKSVSSVINYMTNEGWNLEEIIAQPQYKLYNQNADIIFSKPISKSEMEQLINNSIIN